MRGMSVCGFNGFFKLLFFITLELQIIFTFEIVFEYILKPYLIKKY